MRSVGAVAGVVLLLAVSSAGGDPAAPKRAPRTSFEGPALAFQFPGLLVGVAEYDEGPTGATVFHFPKGAMGAIDVRGGAPGTVNSDYLRLGYENTAVDAVTLAGGSWYGLEAGMGVAAEIMDRGGVPSWRNIAGVPTSIIFDFGRRFNAVYPDRELGRAALRTARAGWFPLGARGGGRFVRQGGYFGEREASGQGGAVTRVGPTHLAVFTVVNAIGAVVDREGRVVRCNHPPSAKVGPSIADHLRADLAHVHEDASAPPPRPQSANTTITLVVTDQKLTFADLQRLAVQVHTSMARGIQPFHTRNDGDVLYAVTTNEVENTKVSPTALGVLASELAWDAILSSVPVKDSVPVSATVPGGDALGTYVGSYELGAGYVVEVTRGGGETLRIRSSGPEPVGYFPEETGLGARSASLFVTDNRWGDRVEFVRDANGTVTGLVLNPGHWPVPARRLPR